jgi:aspartate-semialdehyde dehydrogenase
MRKTPVVAIAGATGAVGAEVLTILEQRNFPLSRLLPLASPKSAGKSVTFRGEKVPIGLLSSEGLRGADLVFMCASTTLSKQLTPEAAKAGAVVVDNTSAFRYTEGVPLVVPEVNGDVLAGHGGIVANPNCSAAILTMALAPLSRAAGLRRVVVSTYQAVSGKGARAVAELEAQTRAWAQGEPEPQEVFGQAIAFNVITGDWAMEENGYTNEENKIAIETRKILGLPGLRISATTARVPVMRCHSQSVNVELERPLGAERARQLLAAAPGVEVMDDRAARRFPTPRALAGQDPVFVGRLRDDPSAENALNLWLCGDQLRKGAALNAIQIAERLMA